MAHIDAAIAERATTQLGLLTYQHLDAAGCSRRMRERRLADGRLLRAGNRVARLPGVPRSWEQRVLAAQFDAGPGAATSHFSAAALGRFHGVGTGAIEVTIPADRRVRAFEGLVHRSRTLDPADVVRSGPFLVTRPARTLLDIAPRLGTRQLQTIVDHLARDGVLLPADLLAELDRLGRRGRAGAAKIDRVVWADGAGPRPESWLERAYLDLLHAAGLPRPQCQVEIRLPDGRIARVDTCFVDRLLIVELAGHATHSTRRERQSDAQRAAALTALGYRVIEFTYEDVTERPAYVVTTTERLLAVAA